MSDPTKQHIAVVANRLAFARDWLLTDFLQNLRKEEVTYVKMNSQIHTRNNTYYIIFRPDQAYGMYFDDIIIAPDYIPSDLEFIVRARVRRKK
jgi:hypothetical protein